MTEHRASTIASRTALYREAVSVIEADYASALTLDDIAVQDRLLPPPAAAGVRRGRRHHVPRRPHGRPHGSRRRAPDRSALLRAERPRSRSATASLRSSPRPSAGTTASPRPSSAFVAASALDDPQGGDEGRSFLLPSSERAPTMAARIDLSLGRVPAVKQRYRFRTPSSGRELILEADPDLVYHDHVTARSCRWWARSSPTARRRPTFRGRSPRCDLPALRRDVPARPERVPDVRPPHDGARRLTVLP